MVLQTSGAGEMASAACRKLVAELTAGEPRRGERGWIPFGIYGQQLNRITWTGFEKRAPFLPYYFSISQFQMGFFPSAGYLDLFLSKNLFDIKNGLDHPRIKESHPGQTCMV